jgi:1-phosphofructokinase family hexose kinase
VILTVTPNPSLDLLFETGRLVWDDANRLDAPRRRPGGQGINLTRAARALGGSSVAVALLGGAVGDELEHMLSAESTPLVRIDIDGETRLFVGARESETGRSLLLNPRGPTIPAAQVERITKEIYDAIERLKPDWVACCGSIPPGLPPDLYARIGEFARARGARFVADCDGETLRRAASCASLLVPNQHEAARLLETHIADAVSAGAAARQLTTLGPDLAAITLGADGAVLHDRQHSWHAAPPRLNRGSAVGAGDAFLAALLVALENGHDPRDCLITAVAAGAAVLMSRGSDLIDRETVLELKDAIEARSLC